MNNARELDTISELRWTDGSDYPLDWNGPTSRPFDSFQDQDKAKSIIELLEAVACRNPHRIAMSGPRFSITYSDLWRMVLSRAERIAAATTPGHLVAILAPVSTTTPIAPIAMLACLAAGRPFVAIDHDSPTEWIAQVLRDSRPALLLTSNEALEVISEIGEAPPTLDLTDHCEDTSSLWRPVYMRADEAACVLFTSGSTGCPKSIVNSQRNLLQRVSQSINAAHINGDDRLLTLTSLCTIVGVRDLLTALLAGASIWCFDPQKCGVREIHRIIRDERISILFAFPALLRTVIQGSEMRPTEWLRLVRVGGDTTHWSDIMLLRGWMAPGTFIQSIYAATEAPMMQWFVGAGLPGDEPRIPIGYPLRGNDLAVINENGTPTRAGEVGELLVRSPYVALGTWPLGIHEAPNIQIDGDDSSARILRTGDLVRLRPDGLYDRIGRKDRQVKIRGVRVELDGVEAAIRRHALVRDVAVVTRMDHDYGAAKLVAYVQLLDVAPDDGLREVETMMRLTVPSQMQPWRYYATPTIPRLSNSKLDIRTLHARDLARSEEETESLYTRVEDDPTEILVARIWRDILGLALVKADDDFFDLGGDSLRAIAMTIELEKALQRELPINLINQTPAFAAFCKVLRASGPAVYSPLVVLKPGNRLPPLFFIHGVGGNVMELFYIARKIKWNGAVIGIQARGLDGNDRPARTVEAMAVEYLRAAKSYQPKGPYLLCGYSFGGLVAFEMARRLRADGEDVALLGLIDTLPPGHHYLRLWTWAGHLYRRMTEGGASMKHGALRNIASAALMASAIYQPRKYPGQVTLFEPVSRDFGLPSSAPHWSKHAGSVRLHTLEGRHDDMLKKTQAQGAADLLTRCLEEAIGSTVVRQQFGRE